MLVYYMVLKIIPVKVRELTSNRFTMSNHLINHYRSLLANVMAALFILASVSSCKRNNNAPQSTASVLGVTAYRIIPETFTVNIRATGDLISWEDVEIKTPVTGTVLKIYFNEGDYVREGDLLVEMDHRVWSAQKSGLEARLLSAESDLRRKLGLLDIEGVSREEVERSQAEVSQLKAQIEELEVMIDLAHIRAPFDGRLGMRNFSLGAFLTQGEKITRLVQTDRLRVHFNIPARYASLISIGDEITIISSSSGDSAFAVIYAIDPIISTASRSLQIRARLNNTRNFIAGDFTQIIFGVEQNEDALLIPAESLIPELNRQVVYIAENGHAKRVEVEPGARTRNRVHIINGLSSGDIVITTGLMEIRDGMPVEVRELIQEASE
jgi:membrane fusion protein, multidrug efflux system